ncbi:hypothetical protein ACQWFX_25840, partial [Salmonella enterica subsp. enterica serovar Infantis]
WALFHLLDAGMVQETAGRGRQLVADDFDGRRVVLELTAGRDFNPVSRELLQNFICRAWALLCAVQQWYQHRRCSAGCRS